MIPRPLALAAVLGLALVSTGCGGNITPAAIRPVASPTIKDRSTGPASAAVVPSAESTATSQPPAPTVLPSNPTAPASAWPTPTLNDDGFIIKKIGERGAIRSGEDVTFSFAVLRVQRDIKCTSEDASEPANGHFIGIYVDAIGTRFLPEADPSSIDMHDWSVVGPDGVEENDVTGYGSWCMSSSEQMPKYIDNATHRRGWIVLDTVNTSGELRFGAGVDNLHKLEIDF